MPTIEWPAAKIAKLRFLWAAGLTINAIGKELNITRNAVSGKVNRLHLAQRASPIKRMDGYVKPKLKRERNAAMAEISCDVDCKSGDTLAISGFDNADSKYKITVPKARAKSCCWPVGDPKQYGFRFCDKPSVIGKNYCESHTAIAFLKPKKLEGIG